MFANLILGTAYLKVWNFSSVAGSEKLQEILSASKGKDLLQLQFNTAFGQCILDA